MRNFIKAGLWPVVLVVASAVMAGCEPKPIKGSEETPLEHREKVIGKDFAIRRYFRVANLKAFRTPTDLLQVKLELQNTEDDDIWCDIQVVFYGADGFELEKTNWQPLLLLEEQVTHYETMSLSNKAVDFTILLRNPRESKAD